jgi:hypothetical protein
VGQPKLSNQSIKPLLGIGPFAGLDATTDPYYVDGTYATDVLNLVPNRAYQGLVPIRGRVAGVNILPATPETLAIYYPRGVPTKLVAAAADGNFYRKEIGASPWVNIPVPSWMGNSPSGNPGAFARYKAWLFFSNQDVNDLNYKFDRDFVATFWGITHSPTNPDVDITSPEKGAIYGTAYYYRYTYAANYPANHTLDQESSPSPPSGPFDIGTPLGPPTSNGATVQQAGAPSLSFDTSGGTIPANSYFIGITWITAAGESGISKTAQITTGATGEICVVPPSPPSGATGWNIYTGTSSIGLTQQGGTRDMSGNPNPCSGTGSYEENYTTNGAPAPPYTGFLSPPSQPIIHTTAGGSLPPRTEYYQLTYVNNNGETTPSPETAITLAGNHLAVVVSPGANANATGYNVYASLTSAQEVIQNDNPVDIGTNWTEPTSGLTLGQSVSISMIGSADPQVTAINVYRIGGESLGNWYFVGSIPNVPGPGQIYVDNIPDSQITGKALVIARDPPAPFKAIFTHVERMWGFGYPAYTGFNIGADGNVHDGRLADLWYSNYNEPWGFDNTNQVIPVGSTDGGDIAVNGAELSSIGILWKAKTTWALYGQSPSDFFVQKLFDVGATAQNACIVALGVAFWLSQQGIYMFDGATLTYLSKSVKKILDSFSQADMAAACACFDDRIVWFSFPTQGISLGYDTVGQNWFKSSLSTTIFAFDTEAPSRPTAADYVFGANPSNAIDQWFAATTDLGLPINSTLLTRLASSGPQIGTMRVRYIELIASANIGPSEQVTVTVTANPASNARAYSKTFGPSTINLRQRFSVPAGIQGDELQLQMTAASSDGLVLEGMGAHGWVRRLYNVVA